MAKRNIDKGTNTENLTVVSFGINEIGHSLLKSIENHNVIVETGDKNIEDKIPEMLANVCYNPKLETIMNHKLKENATDIEGLKMKEIRDNTVLTLPILEEIKKIADMVPEGYALKCKERTKKDNENKYIKMKFFPGILGFFENPNFKTNTKPIPSSVLAFMFTDLGNAETGEKLFEIKFVSVVYSQYTRKYDLHKWRGIYTLVKSKIESETNRDKFIDNMF
ncbi:MAG: hypothetical protein ACRCXT_15480 [Paraclostridium sp.]